MAYYDYNKNPPSKFEIIKGKWINFWFEWHGSDFNSYGSKSHSWKTLKKQKIYNVLFLIGIITLLILEIIT